MCVITTVNSMVTVYIDIYKVSLESSLQGNILIYISMLVLKTFLHGMITKNDRMSKTCSSYYISKYILDTYIEYSLR